MKSLRFADGADLTPIAQEVAEVVTSGGLVCVPCSGTYRLLVDLNDTNAVLTMMQSKRRVGRAPALIFIDSVENLSLVTDDVDPLAFEIARSLWPAPLTIRVGLKEGLPSTVVKQLGGSKARVGVRVPRDPMARAIAELTGRPLLASSANREKKHGESSPAQVRKTFGHSVDLFVDCGDLPPATGSTVIEVRAGNLTVERAGAIDEDTLRRIAAEVQGEA